MFTYNWFVADTWFTEYYFPWRQTGTGSTGTVKIRNTSGTAALPVPSWATGTILRAKFWAAAAYLADIWMRVTGVASTTAEYIEYNYIITHGPALTIPAGTTIVSYGLPGDGFLLLSAAPGKGAFVEVVTHGGEPWLTQSRYARFGSLAGFLDVADDSGEIGLGVATDPTDPYTPYIIAGSDRGVELYGVAQKWTSLVDGVRTVRAEVDPDAGDSDYVLWAGGTSSNPGLWVQGDGTTGIRDDLLIGSRADTLFTASRGAMLLGPNMPASWTRSVFAWVDSRGRSATISGNLRYVGGPWEGTQALTMMPAVTNLIHDPIAGDGTSSYWAAMNANTTLARTNTVTPVRGDYCFRVTPTAAGVSVGIKKVTAVGSPAENAYYTLSAYVRTNVQTDRTAWVSIREIGGAASVGKEAQLPATSSNWQRLSVSHQVSQAGLTGLDVYIYVDGLAVGEYAYIDAVNLTATGYPAPHVDGDMPGCTWGVSGANLDDSTVTTKTTLDLANFVDVVNYRDTLTFRAMVQAPYSYRAADNIGTDNSLYLFDMADDSGTAGTRLYWRYVSSTGLWELYAQGQRRLASTASAHTFEAGDWLDMVLVLDIMNNTAAMYADGVLLASGSLNMAQLAVTKWKFGDTYSAGGHGRGQVLAELAVFHTAMSAKAVAALHRMDAPLSDMGYLGQSSGIRFPLHNTTSVVDPPVIAWSDGMSAVSVTPTDDISTPATPELTLTLLADAASTYTKAAVALTANVDGGTSTTLTVADDGVESTGQVKATGFLTGTAVWTLGAYSAGAPAADGYVTITVGADTIQLLGNKV